MAEIDNTAQQPSGRVRAQGGNDAPSFKFDVATIRESEPAAAYSQYVSNPPKLGRFDAVDIWMSQVIAYAFDVNYRYQVVGGQDWVGQQRYVVHAKSDADVDAQLAKLPDDRAKLEKQHMLQSLLTDRFGFRGHIEVRTGPVYFLTVAKPSPNFQEARDEAETDLNSPVHKFSGITTSGSATGLQLEGHQATIGQLAGMLSFYLRTEVIDQTGLSKRYNFKVRFNARPDLQGDAPEDSPTAEAAFAEQIGLKLVRGKGPIKTVVIDSITKPSAN